MFLGWDQPALPAAAAHLIEHYIDGAVADLRPATIVLPGRRARRRVIELLLDEAETRGATLIPPEATTVGGLPGLLCSSPRPLADDTVSRRAWSRALRSVEREAVARVFPHLQDGDGFGEWDKLAGMLAGLHESLAREGHRFADVVKICRSGLLFDDGGRWEVLAKVQQRYLQLLAQAGLADRFETRTAALQSDVAHFTRDLWLVSIVELPSVTRRLMEASRAAVRTIIHAPAELDDGTDATAVFDEYGLPSTEYWGTTTVPVTDQVLEVQERPVDQAEAVVTALASLGGKYSAEEVVLGVHAESEVVPYLEQRLEARGVPARYAAGTPLARMGSVRLLQAVADYMEERTFKALAALLRHPDAGALAGPTDAEAAGLEAIEVADRYFAEHLPFSVRGEIPRGRGKASLFPPVVRAIEREGPLGSFGGGRRPLSRWMPEVMNVLLKAYGDLDLDRSRPGHRRLLDTLGRIQSVATTLVDMPSQLDEECTGSGAIRALLLELREEALPPEPRRDVVELLDWLELPLDDAPAVIITGFNEGFLPESVAGHAFLPDALRTRLGLSDDRSRLARDAYRLTSVLHSKESVRLIAGRRTAQGDPLRPSRLMFRIPEEQMPARVLEFSKRDERGPGDSSLASLGLEPGERSRFSVPPEPVIEWEEHEVPNAMAVTAFKALLADPYRFVLERVYRLGSLDDTARELDPLRFGSLAHDVLHRFGLSALGSPPAVDVSDASAVTRSLTETLQDEVSKRFGDEALPAVHLQAEQLASRLRAFSQKQAKWAAAGWRIVGVECQPEAGVPFDVDGTPMLLRGRIDRIDFNATTGQWAVLDYKTGTWVDPPEKAHRQGPRDDREWVDLQLPLYRRLLPGIVDGQGRSIVDLEAVERGDICFGYVSLPQKADDSDFLMADWSEEDLAEAEGTAREAIRRLRAGRFEFDPEVTKVGRAGVDALRPLLAVGWQAAGEDEGKQEGSEQESRDEEGGH